jgi:DNA-binding NarL/FixJ family response regulator
MLVQRNRPLRVLVADHHGIVRAGIKGMLLESRPGLRFELGEASTSEEALESVHNGKYDVVLLDYGLLGRGGIKTTELILQRSPGMAVLGLMGQVERSAVEKLVKAGARGCVLTTIERDTLVEAIRTVADGRQFFSNAIALCLLEPGAAARPDPGERLTIREREVLRGILSGWRSSEVAARMGISKRTVDKHRQHVNAKLGVRNMIELVQAGVRMGLISGLQG